MGKKIIRDMLLVLGLLVLIGSNIRWCMERVSNARNKNMHWWGAHRSLQGDLVQMSYLDDVPRYHDTEDYHFTRPAYDGPKQVALYVSGDSYTWKVPDSAYAGIAAYQYAWRSQYDMKYATDSGRRNVLLVEVSERFIRELFQDTGVIFRQIQRTKAGPEQIANNTVQRQGFGTTGFGKDDIFNPNINQNLEYNIFNYNFLNPIRTGKASLTYRLFHRASGQVALSDNDRYLLLKTTTLPIHSNSSYEPVSDQQIQQYVRTLNIIYGHYKKAGFDEVYVSFIPNPATILQPEGYNGIIPRIEQNPALKMKVISVYDDYRHAKQVIYRHGDTHWNNNGLQLWLKQVNAMLAAENYKASR